MKLKHLIWIPGIAICIMTGDLIAAEARTWTNNKGKTITATFVKAQGGYVYLKRTSGQSIRVQATKLSKADQVWVKQQTSNVLMESLLRNDKIGKQTKALFAKQTKTTDNDQRMKISMDIQKTLGQRKEFQEEAFAAFKRYLPVDQPPFKDYKQSFSLVGALTWTLRDQDNRQLGYVSLSYNTEDNWNKNLKNGGENKELLGIPSREQKGGMWFFLSDNTLLQITFNNPTLEKDGALDAFQKKADIKGLHALGSWK